jgi:hypothetical protein
MEVKLKPTEYFEWFRGRRAKDLPELAKRNPKKPAAAASDAERAKDNQQKAESKDVEKAGDKPADPTKPEPPKVVQPPAEAHKFVDKALDKALEVLRAKLAPAAPADESKKAA